MDRGKRVIGLLLMIVSVALLVTWERWGKPQFLYDEVLVCRENISRGTVIRENMFETVKMDIREKGWIRPEKKASLVGKEAASFIHKGMPLFREYFEQEGLLTGGKGERYVLSVPEEWLESLPASLKRGDRAYFYSGRRFLTSAPVSAADHENCRIEVVVTEKQAAELSGTAAAGGKLVLVYSE